MERYAANILVLIRVKQMYCWADSAWLYIFHFWKCVTQGIKALFENKAADPVPPKLGLLVSFFLSFSFSLSLSLSFFRLIPLSTEALWVHFLSGFLRLSREGALHLHPIERVPEAFMNRASPMSGALLVFCVNQGISASFSLLYFLSRRCRSPWGYPWILLGWTPAHGLGDKESHEFQWLLLTILMIYRLTFSLWTPYHPLYFTFY